MRTPPQATDVEEIILGAMLFDKESVDTAFEILQPEDFYEPRNKAIFESMQNLHLKGKAIDVVSVTQILKDKKLENYCIDLTALDRGSSSNTGYYCEIVKDKSLNEAFLYPRKLNDYQRDVLKGYKDDPRMQFNPDNRTMEQNLKIVYFGYEEQLRPLYEELKKVFGNAIEAKLSPEKYGGGYFLTLLHPEGDKAHAMQKVMEYLERDHGDITVFGDSVNDLGMFKLAGTSVAVSNALDEVKAVADLILPHSNDEDAVAKYLKSIK